MIAMQMMMKRMIKLRKRNFKMRSYRRDASEKTVTIIQIRNAKE